MLLPQQHQVSRSGVGKYLQDNVLGSHELPLYKAEIPRPVGKGAPFQAEITPSKGWQSMLSQTHISSGTTSSPSHICSRFG